MNSLHPDLPEPHYTDAAITLHHGDALEVLRELPDASVDSVVTDPPYNLSTSAKRDKKCLREVVTEILLPRDEHHDTERGEGVHLAAPALSGTGLCGEDRAVRVDTRVGMPERAVDLQHPPVVQDEVGASNEAPALATDSDLPLEYDAPPFEFGGNVVLQSADGWDATICDGTCRCFTEPSPGFIAVSVVVPRLAGGNRAAVRLVVEGRDANVGVRHDAGRQAEGSTGVHAGGGAEDRAVLRLDLRRGTGELDLADRTLDNLTPFQLARAEGVGAGAGAGRLSAVSQPYRIRVVDGVTDRTLTLHHIAHVLNSSTGGFMGKDWDGWENPAAFQRWCTAWTAECLRVLKPGGHLVAFGGTRTWHRLACAVEDAGFEVRDSIAWMYGSGFPKSLDVSKAIDKAAGAEREVVGRKGGRDAYGHKPEGSAQGFGGALRWGDTHYSWDDLPPEGQAYYIAGAERRGQITAPATPDAERWQGWGTALKPAFEPIVVARKPLAGTVAANVLEHGIGALNIDGCRIGTTDTLGRTNNDRDPASAAAFLIGEGKGGRFDRSDSAGGRWPANVVLDESQAAALDEQSGESVSNVRVSEDRDEQGDTWSLGRSGVTPRGISDSGGASPFFYIAKAPQDERVRVNGTAHPTVKPLSLMRWLVRLVTPPDGTVLEPFAGSGTTAEACLLEGFKCIAIEREADYLPLIMQRIHRRRDPVEAVRGAGEDGGLFDLLDGEGIT